MTRSNIQELVVETSGCYVAYDADSGDILYIHEIMGELGTCSDSDEHVNCEAVRQLACRDFEKRSIKVIELAHGFELKQEAQYWVDPYTREIIELSVKEQTFRNFLREQTEME